MASIIGVETLQHTNGTTAATIDSSGRINTPARPAFKASHGASSIPHSTVVICTNDSTDGNFNIGNCYSTSTGRFTAPVAGVYQFSITGLYTLSSSTATFKGIWRKNGVGEGVAYEYQTANLNGTFNTIGTSTVLIELDVNDYVDLYNGDTTSNGNVHSSGAQTKLCGYLIG